LKLSFWKVFLFLYVVAAAVLAAAVITANYLPSHRPDAKESRAGALARLTPQFIGSMEGLVKKIASRSWRAEIFFASIYEAKGMAQPALQHYLSAVRVAPANSETHYRLGLFYHESGKTDLAMNEYKEALRLKPNNGKAIEGLAALYRQLGKDEEAAALYQTMMAVVTKMDDGKKVELDDRAPAPQTALPDEPQKPTDSVRLKNGHVMEGTITRKDEKGIWLEVSPGGEVFIPADTIAPDAKATPAGATR
jgi:tetratricopeptide (TPR) repeat protein